MAVKVVFRVDASMQIGTGHVIRCLTLAEGLRDHGAVCSFICREHQGHLLDRIKEKSFDVVTLLDNEEGFLTDSSDLMSLPAHASWLGCGWQTDAEQTISVLNNVQPDWLVVDHYALDARWENVIKPYCKRLMVVDDIADRIHECDLLLDQNLVYEMESRYQDKVPNTCTLLLGLDYALLQPVYAKMHDCVQIKNESVQRILIYFGGADQNKLTERTISAFMQLNRPDIEVDVVISSKSHQAGLIEEQILNKDNIHLHSDLPTLASLMSKADLAIGAGGSTNWERLCLGLPALVVSISENQRQVTKFLNDQGLIKLMGHADEIDNQRIKVELEQILAMPNLFDWSKCCLDACNGKGLLKVVEILMS
ncbi:MAG: UDP-2,4-diacetamido-2,4,6-trideoxy-beta-L-altropyranose hydrolase [Proteobacteria bacterium]|nr:UDP-2,4-diacetamido-2,4,6-trideoxy-beta-L-altropyranose hydrolase [Pseudomonadota bacterium]NOG59083.1 UDP-2,4-diacetamido-2,4,6-trideoxy-beta-L-altropyranose hydrolase [Pseudomonadota bacterium]